MRFSPAGISTYKVTVPPTKAEKEKARRLALEAEVAGRPYTPPPKKQTTRYQARYRIYLPDQKPIEVKQGGFEQKGYAKTFIENARKGILGVDGWEFDADFKPVRRSGAGGDGPAAPDPALSCLVMCEDYWVTHHDSRGPSQNSKARGRLLDFVAATLRDPKDRNALSAALVRQRPGRHRPEPSTTVDRVARYMTDHLFGHPKDDAPEGEGISACRRWLEERSLPRYDLDDKLLLSVRTALGGTAYSSRRTYWSIIAGMLSWAVTSDRLPSDPSAGLPKLARDFEEEKVDPQRTPGEKEIVTIAERLAELVGSWGFTIVIVMAFCALRIGEVVALCRSDVTFTDRGGAWITVTEQDGRQSARHSADRETTRRKGSAPKGRRQGPGARRRIFLPPRWAQHLKAHMDTAVGPRDDDRLFRGARGGWLDPDYFRRCYWTPVIGELFSGHRLEGITPHALRHAGMTLWLRSRIALPMIQKMGGWKSLKVMLDTYAAVLPDDEDLVERLLEEQTAA